MIVIFISRKIVFTNLTFGLQRALDINFLAYVGFEIQQKCKKLQTKMLLMICTRSSYLGASTTNKRTISSFVNGGCTRLITLFEIVITIVITISRMVVFTNLTFGLQRALDMSVFAHVGFRIEQKCKKLETKLLLMICERSCTKALIPLVRAPIAVFANRCCTLPSNVI